jgi:hypothetical protein
MKPLPLLLLLLLATPLCRAAQPDTASDTTPITPNTSLWDGLAASPTWGRPFWADMHSTLVRGEVAYATNSPEYDWADKGGSFRPYVFSNLGADLPVWSGDFANRKFGVSATLPFMIDVWLDMFERTTAPVINNGYRFGAFELGFLHRLDKPLSWSRLPWLELRNYAIRLAPLKHECTHIGDELTIHRTDDTAMRITRVNVSYNYAELQLTLNDPDGTPKRNHALRFGLLLLYNFAQGWYSILPEEGNVDLVEPSNRPFEIYMQYQYQSRTSRRGFQAIASVEFRRRERYNYPFSYSGRLADALERREGRNENWLSRFNSRSCTNVFVGLRYSHPRRSGYFSKIGIGLRYYSGINPYGQFRSQPIYQQWGAAVIFE